jgi:hypothetical protein
MPQEVQSSSIGPKCYNLIINLIYFRDAPQLLQYFYVSHQQTAYSKDKFPHHTIQLQLQNGMAII